jgi:hypothetical protein
VSAKHATNLDVELVTVPAEPIAGEKTMLFFRLKPAEGVEPYIGAWAHLLAVSNDSIDLIHSHPYIVDDGPPSPIPWATWAMPFKIIFPRDATYKIWVQLQRKGVVNTVSFTVPVRSVK